VSDFDARVYFGMRIGWKSLIIVRVREGKQTYGSIMPLMSNMFCDVVCDGSLSSK
jgi:hypothetical protein